MNSRSLIEQFGRAGLPLELNDAPLFGGRGATDIVQIDIARPNGRVRHERIRLFCGAQTNRVEVENVDKHRQQLVLMVHEPRRAFETFVWKHTRVGKKPPANVIREDKRGWTVENFTEGRKRHFLTGMDEQHLFIAQLPRGTSSVQGAHMMLKGDDVRAAERGAFEETIRQGEWFFISLKPREATEVAFESGLERAKVSREKGIAESAGWSRLGRPHVADEVLVLGTKVYVRGKIRHPDHATITLREWRRVLGNTEASTRPVGVNFFD